MTASNKLILAVSTLLICSVATASAQSRPALRRDPNAVQFMITAIMKQQLVDLGYSEADIESLNPQRAAAIIDNNIHCPSQGVPSTWKRSSARGGKSRGFLSQAVGGLTQLATFGLAAAVALHFCGMDLGVFSDHVDTIAKVLIDSTRS